MSAATSPFKDAAHRQRAMRELGVSIVPTAIAFGAVAPLIAVLLMWSGQCIAAVTGTLTGEMPFGAAVDLLTTTLTSVYAAAGIPAAIAGVWVALLSPFAPQRSAFYSGVAAIGAMSTWLFVTAPKIPFFFGGPLFLPIVGALAATLCARLVSAWPLRRYGIELRKARRDRLSRERAQRLAKAREASA